MRKVIELIVGVLLVGTLCVGIPSVGGYIETHYTREARVVKAKAEIVIVEDKCGNEWAFEGEGFEIGQKVTLKMFNNYTDSNIEDDEIIGVK